MGKNLYKDEPSQDMFDDLVDAFLKDKIGSSGYKIIKKALTKKAGRGGIINQLHQLFGGR